MCAEETLLVERARRGDHFAFEQMVRAFHSRIRAFLATRLWDSSLVDDLAQEVFIIAHGRLGTLKSVTHFYAWLRGIALNVLRNEERKRARLSAFSAALERAAKEQAERLEGRAADPGLLGTLRDCMDRLDAGSARIVRARYTDGLPVKEIAARERRNHKALSVALVRIRQKLRECIEGRLSAAAEGLL